MKVTKSILASILLLVSVFYIFIDSSAMAESQPSSQAEVHIVYVEKPQEEDPEAFHLRTLSTVVGSEDVAKEKILYHYKHAASGFSAKLTPEQVSEISKQPGVLHVVKSGTAQLHSGPGKVHTTKLHF